MDATHGRRATITTFVLVHGAWHGGWCYKRVARLLRQAGYEVYTPTLTGLGERAHLMNRAIDLNTHVQDILGVIHCEELSDVVLCGHSYGGMVITGVAEQVAAKIRSLVYLDAFVPENGKSLFDYLPAERSEQMRTDAAQNGEGYKVTPIPATAFAVNAEDVAWVDAMCVKQPLATFEQKLALNGRQGPKRVYILAADWGPSPFQQFGARFKEDRGWQFISIACGHDVMVDRPHELAAALIAAA
jgi:pimeloyl-ACP methyl ester carboxylesterase